MRDAGYSGSTPASDMGPPARVPSSFSNGPAPFPGPQPTLGRMVRYHAKTRGYPLVAVVTAAWDTLDAEGVDRGDVPPLSSDMHVHLEVLTPGAKERYQEFDIGPGYGPGQWCWPPRH